MLVLLFINFVFEIFNGGFEVDKSRKNNRNFGLLKYKPKLSGHEFV